MASRATRARATRSRKTRETRRHDRKPIAHPQRPTQEPDLQDRGVDPPARTRCAITTAMGRVVTPGAGQEPDSVRRTYGPEPVSRTRGERRHGERPDKRDSATVGLGDRRACLRCGRNHPHGPFQVIAGLAAIIDDEFFLVTRNYTFELDTSAWGWIDLLLGVLLLFAGWGLFTGAAWGSGYGDLCWPGSARWRTSSSSPTTPSGRSS